MIVVAVRINPFGDESIRQDLARILILNDLTGTPSWGNYEYTILESTAKVPVRGKIKRHYRKNGVLELVARVLDDAGL